MNWICILDSQPTYRQMGDIDFLVPSEHFERARLLMLEQNYKPLDSADEKVCARLMNYIMEQGN